MNISNSDLFLTTGGFNDKAVLRTMSGTAMLIGSIAAGQPELAIISCVEIGYNLARIAD